MEPLFKNKTVMDKKTCIEFMSLTWPKNAGKLRIVLYILAGVAVVYSIVQLVMYGIAALGMVFGIILMGGVSFFLAHWGYRLRTGVYVSNQQSAWGGETLEKEVTFYEDKIIQTSCLGKLEFSYNKLTGFLVGKNSIVLEMGDDALLMQKNGFTKGSIEEFSNFLQSKIPQKQSSVLKK